MMAKVTGLQARKISRWETLWSGCMTNLHVMQSKLCVCVCFFFVPKVCHEFILSSSVS